MAGEEEQLQQAEEAPMEQAGQQEASKTPLGLILTGWGLALGLVLGVGLLSFFPLDLFLAIYVFSLVCLPTFVILLLISKNTTARVNGVIIIVVLLAACRILGEKLD